MTPAVPSIWLLRLAPRAQIDLSVSEIEFGAVLAFGLVIQCDNSWHCPWTLNA